MQICITHRRSEVRTYVENDGVNYFLPVQFHAVPVPRFYSIRRPPGHSTHYPNPPHVPEVTFPSRALHSWPEKDSEFSQKKEFDDESSSSDEDENLLKRVVRRRFACDSQVNEGASTSGLNNFKSNLNPVGKESHASQHVQSQGIESSARYTFDNPPKRKGRRRKPGGRRRRAARQLKEMKDSDSRWQHVYVP